MKKNQQKVKGKEETTHKKAKAKDSKVGPSSASDS
jgi:hypothetical protein